LERKAEAAAKLNLEMKIGAGTHTDQKR